MYIEIKNCLKSKQFLNIFLTIGVERQNLNLELSLHFVSFLHVICSMSVCKCFVF